MDLANLVYGTGPMWNVSHAHFKSTVELYRNAPDDYLQVANSRQNIVGQKMRLANQMLRRKANDKPTELGSIVDDNGVLHMDLIGNIVPSPSSRSRYYGVPEVPLDLLQQILVTAENDKSVKAYAWVISGPGGVAIESRNFVDWASKRLQKPIFSFVREEACSASMDLASLSEFITVSPNGMMGSVGTLLSLSAAKKDFLGAVDVLYFYSSGSLKSLDASSDTEGLLTPEMDSELRRLADGMGEKIAQSVFSKRGITNKKIREEIATGKIFFSEESVTNGLANYVGDYEDFLKKLESRMKKNPRKTPRAGNTTMPLDEDNIRNGREMDDDDSILLLPEETPESTPASNTNPIIPAEGVTGVQVEILNLLKTAGIDNVSGLSELINQAKAGRDAFGDIKNVATKYATMLGIKPGNYDEMSYEQLKNEATNLRKLAGSRTNVVVETEVPGRLSIPEETKPVQNTSPVIGGGLDPAEVLAYGG